MMILIDGPQGCGKSTAVDSYLLSHPGTIHRKFDDHFYMQDYLEDDYLKSLEGVDFIYERGILSYSIYGMLWNAEQFIVDGKINWSVISRRDYENAVEKLDHIYIMYASRVEMLYERIKRRAAETGRVLPQRQYDVVGYSNALFLGYGHFLEMINPDKVTLVDCSTENMLEML